MVWRTNFDRFLKGASEESKKTGEGHTSWPNAASPSGPLHRTVDCQLLRSGPRNIQLHCVHVRAGSLSTLEASASSPQLSTNIRKATERTLTSARKQLSPPQRSSAASPPPPREAPRVMLPTLEEPTVYPPPPTNAESEFAAAGFLDEASANGATGQANLLLGAHRAQVPTERQQDAREQGLGSAVSGGSSDPWHCETHSGSSGGDPTTSSLDRLAKQLGILSETVALLDQRLTVAEEKESSMEKILAQVRLYASYVASTDA